MKTVNSRLKSLFAVLIAVMMMVSVFPMPSLAVDDFEGYTPISTAEELANIANDMDGKYYLTQNIELTGTWSPIGLGRSGSYTDVAFSGTAFKGILDGNGYKITGLTVDCETYAGVGLFAGVGSGAEIRNLTIDGADVYGRYWTGAIAGINNGAIENCHVVNSTIAGREGTTPLSDYNYVGGSQIGGISGWNQADGSITECSVRLTSVFGNRYVGGITGVNNGLIEKTFVRDCDGSDWIGSRYQKTDAGNGSVAIRIVANHMINLINNNLPISDNVPYMFVGGIAGANQENNGMGTVRNCYVVATQLNSIDAMAELIGVNWGNVENCYTAENGLSYYSYFDIGNSISFIPDFIARNIHVVGGTVRGVHYYNSSSLRLRGAGTEHLNGANMKDQSTYTDWNFDSVWTLDAEQTDVNYGYPVFGVSTPEQEPDAPETADIPDIITGNDVIRVECITDGTAHGPEDYGIIDGSYTIGKVEKDGADYTVDVTVTGASYVAEYNKTYDGHVLDSSTPSPAVITLTWDEASSAWTVPAAAAKPYITFKVTHEEPDAPDKPEDTEIPGILADDDIISVECINPVSPHDAVDYGILEGSYTVGDVNTDGTSYTVDVTIDSALYVAEYNETYAGHTYHSSAPSPAVITLTWDGDSDAWTVPATAAKPYITFNVMHEEPVVPTAPEAADVLEVLAGNDIIRVDCVNAADGHAPADYGLITGSYTIGAVYTVDRTRTTVYAVDITIDGAPYVEAYNAVNGDHDLNGSTPSPAVITLTWDDVAGKWTAAGTKPYVTFSVMHEDQGTADFALTKTAGVAYARVGDTITYTITVTNTGDVDLFGVELQDVMFSSENCGKILVNGAEIIPVNGAIAVDIPVGEAVTVTYEYTVPESALGGEIANVVIASYDGGTVAKASRCVVTVLPGDPSFENISALLNGKITVACLGNTHDSRIYDIVENGFALGDVTFNDGNGITCEIIINDDLYVSMYSNDIGAQHTSDTVNENAIVTVSYDAATGEWSLPENFTGILLSAVCNDGTGGGQTGTDPGATPDTGDDAPVALAAGTVIVSLAVLVIAFVAKRRRSNVA